VGRRRLTITTNALIAVITAESGMTVAAVAAVEVVPGGTIVVVGSV
jgi:hypothetical protein